MPDSSSPGTAAFTPVVLVLAGREFLSCSCAYPADWQRLSVPPEGPPEEPDVQTDMTAFLPLLVSMAGYGAVLFTVGARPAYSDGTVLDWARFLSEKNGLTLETARPITLAGLPAVQCEATQPSDAGLMRLRVVFLEDGGRLFNLGALAPDQIWKSVEAQLTACLQTFRLTNVQGPTVPLGPANFIPPPDPIEHPKPNDVTPKPEHLQGIVTNNPHAKANPPPAPSPDSDRVVTAAEVAIADDAGHLAEDHPVNVSLRNRGIGLVPRVLSTHPAEKYSLLAAGAIEHAFRLPFGWHAIDDGQRTLAFDHENAIQISFNLRPGTTVDVPQLFQSILADLLKAHGDFQYFEFTVRGFQALGAKDLQIEGEVLQQCYLARESHRPGLLLVCRVTANAERMNFAIATAGMMLTTMQPPLAESEAESPPKRKSSAERRAIAETAAENTAEPPPKPRSSAERRAAVEAAAEAAAAKPKAPPDWWEQAVALEAQDKLHEADAVILRAIDHLGVYSQLAHLYELRAKRLAAQGNQAEARKALETSCNWMDTMASQATSGGEGAALSLQAQQHRARLGL